MDEIWQPIGMEEAVERFSAVDVDWWIAGGLAIDLFLGWESRKHDDIDIEMFRRDRDALFDVFPGWELFTVAEGALTPWARGAAIEKPVFGMWGRPSSDQPWAVEVMLADGDGDRWRFRRDPSISMQRSRLTRTSPSGIRYCTPEVQLLYKAKQARPKDDVDFARCMHLMTDEQKDWLADALAIQEPSHPWIDALAMTQRVTAKPE
ncbi:MAG: nucleotidyltransferase domain-containing protein [Acidimicrobiia bacterium]